MSSIQYVLLCSLLLVGLAVATIAPIQGLTASILVALGLCAAVFAPVCSVRRALRQRTLDSSVVAACSWATGWLLWPFWINGVHLHENSFRAFVSFPPKTLPPGVWMHDLWALGGLLGFWLAVLWILTYVAATGVLCIRANRWPSREQSVTVAIALVFAGVFWPSVDHALNWMLD